MVALGTPSELKHRSMRGELLLLECEPLGEAVEALQGVREVIDAAVFGNAMHVLVPNGEKAIPLLRRYLAEKGITVNRVEGIRPSLEDVFVSLTTERSRKGVA